MLVIQLPKNVVIYTDYEYNYIYAEIKTIGYIEGVFKPKPENIGNKFFVELGYYPTFEACWNGAIDYIGLKADSLKEYGEIIDLIGKIKALKFPKTEIPTPSEIRRNPTNRSVKRPKNIINEQ